MFSILLFLNIDPLFFSFYLLHVNLQDSSVSRTSACSSEIEFINRPILNMGFINRGGGGGGAGVNIRNRNKYARVSLSDIQPPRVDKSHI